MSDKKDNVYQFNKIIRRIQSWYKYSHDKTIAVVSCGFFWDFRNTRPDKKYITLVDDILDIYEKSIEDLRMNTYYLWLDTDKHTSFWIANKYYGWRCESSAFSSQTLTLIQIDRVNNLINKIQQT